MINRRITHAEITETGEVVGVCNFRLSSSEPDDWVYEKKIEVLRHLQSGRYCYFVDRAGYRSEVIIRSEKGEKYITTNVEISSENNLQNLPHCF